MRKNRRHPLATRTSIDASPRLLTRQRELLRLLDALGGSVGNRDFQKLLLLYCEEPMSGRPYDFVPYKYGAFSFTSYADRRKLIERGLLVDDEHHWRLTDEGVGAVGGTSDMQIAAFVRQHGSLRGDALVAETYRRFPYYAIRSEIAERVLSGDQDVAEALEAQLGLDTRHLIRTTVDKQRVLITMKTYPTLSPKYGGTAETFRPVDQSELQPAGHMDTADNWRERRRILLRTARVYERLDELIAGAKANEVSSSVQL